jgi:hypothetical protein
MAKNAEIEKLRKEIAETRREITRKKSIAESINVKNALRKELFELKNPKKFSTARRIKTGLKILGKKAIRQARLIKEQQFRESAIQKRIQRPTKIRKLPKIPKKGKLRITKKARKASGGGFNPFGELNF